MAIIRKNATLNEACNRNLFNKNSIGNNFTRIRNDLTNINNDFKQNKQTLAFQTPSHNDGKSNSNFFTQKQLNRSTSRYVERDSR